MNFLNYAERHEIMNHENCEENDKSIVRETTELIIASIAILFLISVLIISATFPENHLRLSHIVFGAIAGLSGIVIWENKINC